jgi:hypothetical protein
MTENTRVAPPVLVRGTVKFPDHASFMKGALARVVLQDVSMADAPAIDIVDTVIALDSADPFKFELRGGVRICGNGRPKPSFAVSVHVKPSKNSEQPGIDKNTPIENGDFINNSAYPVEIDSNNPADLTIEVYEVGRIYAQ